MSKRRGFTLIELLAVITIIAILAAALAPQIPKFIDKAKVTACRANMTELYRSFLLYKDRFKDWPSNSGIHFFAKLWKVETDFHDDSFAKRFTCPGVPPRLLTGLGERPPREWFDDWAALDSSYTAYAGRDIAKYPNVDKNPGNQALLADSNQFADTDVDPTPNHAYATLVLMADGHVQEYDLFELREKKIIGEKEYLIPGPNCPVPELKTLSREPDRRLK